MAHDNVNILGLSSVLAAIYDVNHRG